MFKIGDFSRLAQVSVRMLRHYDKLGLLTPSQTDKWTGYRYYTIDQLGDLPEELAAEPMESYSATDAATVSFEANWKVDTDNFVEGYHIPGTHPSFHAAIDFEAFETTADHGFVKMTAPPKDGLFYRGKWL